MTTGSFVVSVTKNTTDFQVYFMQMSLMEQDFVKLPITIQDGSGKMDGSVAVTYCFDDQAIDTTVHLFWTKSLQQIDGEMYPYTDGIVHGVYDPVNQTISSSTNPIAGVKGVGQPEDVYTNDSDTWDEVEEPRHIISATFDKSVNRMRLVWPKGTTGLLRTGRYISLYNRFTDGNPTDLTPNSSNLNAQMVNSIAYANYNTTSVPAWLKSSSLKMENFIASDKSTWRCTTSGTNNESDDWGSKQDQPELSVTYGYARTTVAARGNRVPRYAGRGDGIQDSSGGVSGSVFADGIITLGRGRQPVIRSNANNFIDQYVVSQTARMDMNDDSIPKNAPLAVVPMRP